MIPVILESPYSPKNGYSIMDNIRYARLAMRDCLLRGEAPFASHLLYTQPTVLRDEVPEERVHGIQAGFVWRRYALYTVFYTDLGFSDGMQQAMKVCLEEKARYELRKLPNWVI